MTKITFPIPYIVEATYGRYRNPQRVEIADEAEFELRDVNEADAPVLVSVQEAYHDHRFDTEEHFQPYPRTELRQFEGAWYAPVLKFTKDGSEGVRWVKPEDFAEIYATKANWSTVVESTNYLTNDQEKLIRRQGTGYLDKLKDAKLRKIVDPDGPRMNSIQWARNELENYICIDGEVWEKLKGEPALQFWQIGESPLVLQISIGRKHVDQRCGYFRLDRLEDCIDHLKAAYPQHRILMKFDDLQIESGVDFTYDDETLAMRGLLDEAKSALFWTKAHDLTDNLINLKAELKSHDSYAVDPDAVAELMLRFVKATPPDFDKRSFIEAGLARWELRPVYGTAAGMGM